VEENVTAEIMCVVAEEARESYAEDVVHEVPSNSHADMESNVERVVAWVAQWCADNGVPAPSASSSSSAAR
jgi:adenylate kinase